MTAARRVLPYSYADRLVTPPVVVTALVIGGGLVAYVLRVVSSMAMAGVDPAPVVQLVATIVAAIGTLGTFALQLLSRAQASRTEAHAGKTQAALEKAMGTAPAPAPTTVA